MTFNIHLRHFECALDFQRMDLGECSKIHDLALRADYEIASKERDLFFELDVSDVHKAGLLLFIWFIVTLLLYEEWLAL